LPRVTAVTLGSARLSRRAFLRRAAAAVTTLALTELTRRPLAVPHNHRPPTLVGRPRDIQVSRDSFTLHGEPSLAVKPLDPGGLLGCCMAQGSTTQTVATYSSFDQGSTWTSNGSLPGDGGYYVNASVSFDAEGRGFVSTVAGTSPNAQDLGVLVWRTDDGGRTFGPPVLAASGRSDHAWLATSPTPRRPAAPLHLVWGSIGAGLGYTRSTDGGTTFDAARILPGTSPRIVGWPMAAAGPDGALHVVYLGERNADGAGSTPVLVSSSPDNGATFSEPIEVFPQPTQPPSRLGGPALGKSNPVIAASPRDGSIHVAAVRYKARSDRSDIIVSSSHDAGRSWSRPTPLASSRRVIYFSPKLAVDDVGRLSLLAYALHTDGVDVVVLVSEPGTARFGPPTQITRHPFDPAYAQNRGGFYWLGDYQGIAASQRAIHPFWTDTRTGQMQIFTTSVPTSNRR
jgi:hypothetical protein